MGDRRRLKRRIWLAGCILKSFPMGRTDGMNLLNGAVNEGVKQLGLVALPITGNLEVIADDWVGAVHGVKRQTLNRFHAF